MVLERGKDKDNVSLYAAQHPNCPTDLLRKILEKGEDTLISQYAAQNPNCPPDLLKMVLEKGGNDLVSWYAALNPNCPTDVLRKILEKNKDDEISYYASQNPNCPPDVMIKWMQDTGQIGKEDPKKHIIEYDNNINDIDEDLEKLKQLISDKKFNLKKYSQEKEDYYNIETARDTNDPDILRKILEQGKNDWTNGYAASNPNCPTDSLRKILEKGEDNFVSCHAASNPNCPSSALRIVLERGKDDWVSYYASQNPNCPPDAYIKWMYDTGKIEKEDPEKHIIEYDNNEENNIDEDLEKLKQLISNKKFNLKKYSQQDYYNIETAKDPNTNPDILRKILERGENDDVSQYAANNPNCPSDILRKILEKGDNNSVSCNAASNKNCPPDLLKMVLKMVLEKNKNYYVVSWYAAQNPNCPPDALKMVLERGKDDYVSQWAALNPNCPSSAYIKWMMDTGKIGKEDPSKHIIEYTDNEEKIDEDLEKLKQLISKNNNLKKYSQQDYYNEETAIATTNPDILRKILEKGNNDIVSWRAAENPKCPKDARINWLIDIGKKEQAQREINNAYLEDFLKQYNKTEII
jgi:hypothetical protein